MMLDEAEDGLKKKILLQEMPRDSLDAAKRWSVDWELLMNAFKDFLILKGHGLDQDQVRGQAV